MTRLGSLCGSVLLVAACSGGTAAPTPTTAPRPTAFPVATSSVAPTIRPTPTPVPGVGVCPTDSPLSVRQFSAADPACFGSGELVVRGWLDGPPGLGFEPPLIEPRWVAYPAPGLPTLWNEKPVDPDHNCNFDNPTCGWFFLHLDPTSGLDLRAMKRWIVVTGHLDDLASATCHYVYSDDWVGDHLDDAAAVATCRGEFVVVSFLDTP